MTVSLKTLCGRAACGVVWMCVMGCVSFCFYGLDMDDGMWRRRVPCGRYVKLLFIMYILRKQQSPNAKKTLDNPVGLVTGRSSMAGVGQGSSSRLEATVLQSCNTLHALSELLVAPVSCVVERPLECLVLRLVLSGRRHGAGFSGCWAEAGGDRKKSQASRVSGLRCGGSTRRSGRGWHVREARRCLGGVGGALLSF